MFEGEGNYKATAPAFPLMVDYFAAVRAKNLPSERQSEAGALDSL